MRTALPVLCLATGTGLLLGWLACDRMTDSALGEEARLAIELRCGQSAAPSAAGECRRMLKRVFLSGSLDPDKTLRGYCDSIETGRWGGTRPPPPEVCVERYGGWREG